MIRATALVFVALPACYATPYDTYYTPRASVYVSPPPAYVRPYGLGPRVLPPPVRYYAPPRHYYYRR